MYPQGYLFKYKLKMIFKYTFYDAQKIVFNNFFTVGWYYENPFDKIIVDAWEKAKVCQEEKIDLFIYLLSEL
jgi:hypothetical protein